MRDKSVRIGGNDYNVDDDGYTHINIYSNGQTRLGRDLSNFTQFKVTTPHGMFESMEGYYHYLKLYRSLIAGGMSTEDNADTFAQLDGLRTVYGRAAQLLGRSLRKQFTDMQIWIVDVPDAGFNADFETALLNRIVNDGQLYDKVLSNSLPYVHYYATTKYVHYEQRFDWLADRVNCVVEKIKEEYYDLSK